jgi:type I restriction enzyme S subunit
LSTSILKLRELLHSDDSGEWGESPSGTNALLILRAGNIADETWLDLSDVVHRTITEPKRTRLLLREGDILLERSGGTDTRPVGRVAFVDRDMEAGFSNFLHRLRVNRSVADPSYVRFVLAHWHRSGRAVALQTQTTGIRNLMFSRYLDEPIRLPSLINQRKFASILESATACLAHTDALIAAKREQKRGLMQQLLTGKVRFPGFTEPWKTVRLGDLGAIRSGGTPSTATAEHWGGPHAWCTPTDVTALRTRHLSTTGRTLTDSGLSESAAEVLPPNSVIVCTRATIGIAAINTAPMATNQGFKTIVPNRDVDCDFLYYAIINAKAELVRRAAGSTFTEVSLSAFRDIAIAWPSSTEEQQRIGAALACVDTEIALIASQREAFATQRRGLMERLLSGEIDIPSADTSAA